jgi:glucose-6-phosphate 1-dehydrogenase
MTEVDRHLFVIFGGTGDLARRKLIPSLQRLVAENELQGGCVILGLGSADMDDDQYRKWAHEALLDAGRTPEQLAAWPEDSLYFQRFGRDEDAYQKLRTRIEALEEELDLPGNRAFYLALPPSVFPTAITGLGEAGLNHSTGWTRLVIEKPFGTNLASARELNEIVHRHFEESQVYRIDHYLGKETVQNLLTFRFANPMFESSWNRDRVAHVEITVAEELGIESRAAYYEHSGALRDMVQNHLTQLLALVTMEPPISFDAERIRTEKVKAIEAIAPIKPENIVFGQYDAGAVGEEAVPGYRDEDGVAADSRTPTFVGIKLDINTWRWHGVPFFLRTGKRLPKRLTQIAVTYEQPPLCFFHGEEDACGMRSNVLLITLQPDEGIGLLFDVKAPGETLDLHTQTLEFQYHQAYENLPDAYQTLILDVMEGDQTLFVRADEVEASWKLWDPLLEDRPEPYRYLAGTWGPAALDQGLALGGEEWMGR